MSGAFGATGTSATRAVVAAALVLASWGCGDDDDDSVGPGPDAGVDAAADAAAADGGTDAGPDAAAPPSCDAPVETTFAIDPDGEDTQIYASAAFDGDGVWIAYCRPEAGDTGLFDVLVTRVGCDGVATLAPVAVSGVGNDVSPALALSGDRLLVAWTRDSGQFPDNMDIVTRVVSTDGTLVGDAETTLETTRDGAPVAGNVMTATVAARPGGGFWLAGLRADDELSSFQVFVQAMDGEAALDGEADDVAPEPGVGQDAPALTVGADGRVWAAWQRGEADGTETTWFRALDEGVAPARAFADADRTAGPALAADVADPDRVWLSVAADLGIREDLALADVGDPSGAGASDTFGDARDLETWATLSAGDAGQGAVVWLWSIQGIQSGVAAARFSAEADGSIAFGDRVELARAQPAGPYPLGVARLSADWLFVAWSDGDSPAFRLRGRFVRLP